MMAKEVSSYELTTRPVKYELARPHIDYYKPNPEVADMLKKMRIRFDKCDKFHHISRCEAIAPEREWLIENVKGYFADEFDELAMEMLSHGLDHIPPMKYQNWQREMIVSQFKDMDDPDQVEAVSEVLERLMKAYDMENPKIYILVKELLTQYINNLRLDDEFSRYGLMQTVTNKRGDSLRIPNGGANLKNDTSKLFLSYIDKLDQITRDSVNINVEGNVSMRDLMIMIQNTPSTTRVVEGRVVETTAVKRDGKESEEK